METKDALTVADVLAKNLIQFCEQNGVVCEVTLTATLPLRMGGSKMTHSVREARKLDTPIERSVQSSAEPRFTSGKAIRNRQTKEAFEEGKEAYHKGVPAGNNPYVGCVQCLYDSWSAGWHGEHKRALFPGMYHAEKKA